MKAMLLFVVVLILASQVSASGHHGHQGFYVGKLRIGIPIPKIKIHFADILDLSGSHSSSGIGFGHHGGGHHGFGFGGHHGGGHHGIGFGVGIGGHGGGHHG